ncbi:hypothetical protein [Rhizobium sp. RAF56]|uniref:hypothetical protein n=1 Tax=Rhizobium sp. RAF56 TaxID=3233062 RepID=UPI003F9BB4EB
MRRKTAGSLEMTTTTGAVLNPTGKLHKLYIEHDGKVSDKWSIYLDVYERLFAPFRNKPVRLLEIGVMNGGSLEIWRKYFAKAEAIVGCDINPDCSQLRFEDNVIEVIVGDSNSDETQSKILSCSSKYDIIIDDGSHMSSDIVRSFARYFGNLAEGGIYIAEDLHCSYWAGYEGGFNDPYSSMSFFKRLLDVVNKEHWGLPRDRIEALSAFSRKYSVTFDEGDLATIHSVEFVNSLCILRKLPVVRNELGSRKITGREALVVDNIMPFSGTSSRASDEKTNVWSLSSTPLEEEIVANRKLVVGQQLAIEAINNDLAAASNDLAATTNDLAAARMALSDAHAEQKRLQADLDAVYASSSWRASFPVRAVGRGLKAVGKAVRILKRSAPLLLF